jgi:hypothetical protein
VLARLPTERHPQAKCLGAFQRQRQLESADTLLRGLLVYTLAHLSFRQVGAWSVLQELGTLSDTAWRKRLYAAHDWLHWLLGRLLAHPSAQSLPSAFGGCGRLLLVDATRLAAPGGTGDDWRVHTAYDLRAGHLSQVRLTDQTKSEHLQHFALAKDDCVVADGAYGYRKNLAYAQKQNAFVVLRITWESFPLEDASGQRLNLAHWLLTRRGQTACLRAYCVFEGQRYPVRLLAKRLPKEQAQLARKRLLHKAVKSGHPVREQTLRLAEWVLLVTNLKEASWSAQAVWRLYKARWQIELVFKRLKSLLGLCDLRVKQPRAVEAVVYLYLLAWLLQTETQQMLSTLLANLTSVWADWARPLSVWRVSQWSLLALQQAVMGPVHVEQLVAHVQLLQRYVRDGPRKRLHQAQQIRYAWQAPSPAKS